MTTNDTTPTAEQLRDAVTGMAVRYGAATQQYAYSLGDHADKRARHLRAVRRRLVALQRLTRDLSNLAQDVTR